MAFESFPTTIYELSPIRNYYFNIDFYNRYVKNTIDDNSSEYIVEHGDTPESVSMKFYGSDKYWYMILICNNIRDPFFEWNLTDEEMMNYAKEYVDKNISSLKIGGAKKTIDEIVIKSLSNIINNDIMNSSNYTSYKEIVKQLQDMGAYFDENGKIVIPDEYSDSSETSGAVRKIVSKGFIEKLYNNNINWYWQYLFLSDENLNIVMNYIYDVKAVINSFKDISKVIKNANYDTLKSIVLKEREREIDKLYTDLVKKNLERIKIPTAKYMNDLVSAWKYAIDKATNQI